MATKKNVYLSNSCAALNSDPHLLSHHSVPCGAFQKLGYLLGGGVPIIGGSSMLGSVLGSPSFGKLPHCLQDHEEWTLLGLKGPTRRTRPVPPRHRNHPYTPQHAGLGV